MYKMTSQELRAKQRWGGGVGREHTRALLLSSLWLSLESWPLLKCNWILKTTPKNPCWVQYWVVMSRRHPYLKGIWGVSGWGEAGCGEGWGCVVCEPALAWGKAQLRGWGGGSEQRPLAGLPVRVGTRWVPRLPSVTEDHWFYGKPCLQTECWSTCRVDFCLLK